MLLKTITCTPSLKPSKGARGDLLEALVGRGDGFLRANRSAAVRGAQQGSRRGGKRGGGESFFRKISTTFSGIQFFFS